MTPVEHARRAVTALIVRAEWLQASLQPGTPRPYRPSQLSDEAREAADALARAERLERSDVAPGDSPDAIWSEGVDLHTDLLALADAMAERVAQVAGVERLPDASWDASPIRYLEHVSRWLEQAAEVDDTLPGHVQRKCRQYEQRIDALLGHITDGQTLDGLCFVCSGIDASHPTGGGKTLRYRRRHADHGPSEHCTGECRDYIVCEGGSCAPTTAEAGYWHRGFPAWDLRTESDWFCDRIGVQRVTCDECGDRIYRPANAEAPDDYCSDACRTEAAAKAVRDGVTCRCGEPVPQTGRPGRPARYCSDDCRRAADAERKRAA